MQRGNCVGGDCRQLFTTLLNPLNQIFKEQVSRDFLKKEGKTGNSNVDSILK
jgi:hypothetical protein